MTKELRLRLQPVRRRQRWQTRFNCLANGLLLGALAGVVLGLSRVVGMSIALPMIVSAVLAGSVIGMLWGLVGGRSLHGAAVAVDTHYDLKDRAVTALSFLQIESLQEESRSSSVLHRLQLADTLEHLHGLNPREVVPWRVPQTFPVAIMALAIALTLPLVPLPEAPTAVAYPIIQDEGRRLEETMLETLRRQFSERPGRELEELLAKLTHLVDELQSPGVARPDALAKISEMQAAIDEVQAQFNLKSVDGHLKELGESLAEAKPTEEAGQALAEQQFEKASEELEQFDAEQMTPEESRALADKLEEQARKLDEAKQKELSDATQELAQGLDSKDPMQSEEGARQLADFCRDHAIRKGIDKALQSQLAQLAESKMNLRDGQNGGLSNNQSDAPKNNWGRGTTGKPDGDKPTRLDGQRQRVELTGTLGQGPSERETSRADVGQQLAERAYQQKYHQYEKMNEAVLESEALPLGHRQTIRRYFERIRPDREQIEQAMAAESGSALE